MSVTEDILIRISKLLRLASDKGATEGEAQAAMEMAHKLLESHNLTMDAVEEAHGRKQKAGSVGSQRVPVGKWEVSLLNIVAQYNYCHVVRARRYDLTIIGRGTNVAATMVMFEWLRDQESRFWTEAWISDPGYGIMNWRTHKAGFYHGFAIRMHSRLRRTTQTTESASMAIVRVDENKLWVQQHIGKTHAGAKNNRSYNERARAAGYRKGGDATLIKQEALG